MKNNEVLENEEMTVAVEESAENVIVGSTDEETNDVLDAEELEAELEDDFDVVEDENEDEPDGNGRLEYQVKPSEKSDKTHNEKKKAEVKPRRKRLLSLQCGSVMPTKQSFD